MNSKYITKTLVPIMVILIIGSSITLIHKNDLDNPLKGQAQYELTYTNQIENVGEVNLTSLSVRLALLKSWDNIQKVEDLTLEVEPNSTSTDRYENRFAHYTYDEFKVGSYLNLEFHAKLTVNILDYKSINIEGNNYDQDELYNRYSPINPLADPRNPNIVQKANEISLNSESILDKAFAAYRFSSSYLEYRNLNQSMGASYALENGFGDCDEYQNLFIAMSESLGIPAVSHTGWFANFEEGSTYFDEGAVSHAFPMFLAPDIGLLPVDPTRGKDNLMDNWLSTDYKTITLTRGPDNPYRLLNYAWINDTNLSPQINNNYSISIDSLEIQYLSPMRTILLGSLFVFPTIFVLYNVINGYRIKKERKRKLNQLLDPTKKREHSEF